MTEDKNYMLGDWIYHTVRHSKTNKKIFSHPMKITEIQRGGVMTSAGYPLLWKEIEPIPITPEIRKNNGCEHLKDLYLEMTDFEGKTDCILLEIKYVHQLQHLLKLMGTDKEIKI